MKKIILILILFMFCSRVNAACDYSNEVRLSSIASNITYDYSYNNDNTFNIHFYNVTDELFLYYMDKSYFNNNNEVYINNITSGTYMTISVKSVSDSCYSSVHTLYINIPYYNKYYNSEECKNYKDLNICSSEFLSYEITYSILKKAIDNYDNSITAYDDVDIIEEDKTFLDYINIFREKYGLKIIVSLLTIIAFSAFFEVKLRKIKHGL